MRDTATAVLVGTLVTVAAAPLLPFAPLLGGGVGGYVAGADRTSGFQVGLLAGLVAFVLLGALAITLTSIFFPVFTGVVLGLPSFVEGIGLAVVVTAVPFGVFYIVGLSTLGGWVGACVRGRF
jgi:hypothetical protein